MKKEIKYSALIIEKATKDRINEILLTSEKDIEAVKEYLSDPNEYEVIFRKCTLVKGSTLQEAIDLAKANPDDYYCYPASMCTNIIDNSSDYFIETIINDDLSDSENIEDFFWAKQLNADEEKTLRKKYGIVL